MKDNIAQSLSVQWEIQKAHFEANRADVEYTFLIGDLFQMNQNGQLRLSIPYNDLFRMKV